MVKNLPAMKETQVWSLGRKDPLEKGMATLSSILAWRSPWTKKLGGLQFMESQRVSYIYTYTQNAYTHTHSHIYTHTYRHADICIYIHTNIYMHVCVHIHTHTPVLHPWMIFSVPEITTHHVLPRNLFMWLPVTCHLPARHPAFPEPRPMPLECCVAGLWLGLTHPLPGLGTREGRFW